MYPREFRAVWVFEAGKDTLCALTFSWREVGHVYGRYARRGDLGEMGGFDRFLCSRVCWHATLGLVVLFFIRFQSMKNDWRNRGNGNSLIIILFNSFIKSVKAQWKLDALITSYSFSYDEKVHRNIWTFWDKILNNIYK